jgi:hypothetical protein
MITQGQKFDDKHEITHRIAKEIECRQLAQCKKELLFRYNVNENTDTPSSSLLLPTISFRI